MRVAAAVLPLALLANAGSGSDTLTFQGGSVRSPDGRYQVWAAPMDVNGESNLDTAWLIGPDGKHRRLMGYERSALVLWPKGTNRVALLEHDGHLASFHAFPLTGTAPRDRVQGDIERGMAMIRPRLGKVANRDIILVRGMCATVDESGLPPGRGEGSYLSRRASFQINLVTLRATLTSHC